MDGLLLLMLKKRRRKFIHRFPQVACLAFDYISTEIAVRGRFESAELDCLAAHVLSAMKTRRIGLS